MLQWDKLSVLKVQPDSVFVLNFSSSNHAYGFDTRVEYHMYSTRDKGNVFGNRTNVTVYIATDGTLFPCYFPVGI